MSCRSKGTRKLKPVGYGLKFSLLMKYQWLMVISLINLKKSLDA